MSSLKLRATSTGQLVQISPSFVGQVVCFPTVNKTRGEANSRRRDRIGPTTTPPLPMDSDPARSLGAMERGSLLSLILIVSRSDRRKTGSTRAPSRGGGPSGVEVLDHRQPRASAITIRGWQSVRMFNQGFRNTKPSVELKVIKKIQRV